jgi:hypothetical protein
LIVVVSEHFSFPLSVLRRLLAFSLSTTPSKHVITNGVPDAFIATESARPIHATAT